MISIAGRSVWPVGLGAMPLSDRRMLERREQAIATVHAALDAGVGLIDTAAAYAPRAQDFGHNERLVGQAVRSWSGQKAPLVATKGGLTRDPGEVWGRDARPEVLLRSAEESAARLGVAAIDLYYLHRLDPAVGFDEQVRGLAAVQQRGIARSIGLSNVNLPQLLRALELVGGPRDGGVAAVQNEFSPAYRDDRDVLQCCEEVGIAFVCWSPFGGVSRGAVSSRFAEFGRIGSQRGVSPQQVVLAWLLAQGATVLPIPGATRPETIRDSAAAAGLRLTTPELAALDASEPTGLSVFPDSTPQPPW